MPPVCLSEQMRSILRFDVLKFLTLFQSAQQNLYLPQPYFSFYI